MELLTDLPPNLPVPVDDGACHHLTGLRLPAIPLLSTRGDRVDLSALPGRVVLFCYPMTGRPDRALPEGWNQIPGARGCTPQACKFRDHYQELQSQGVEVFGLSTQSPADQREAAQRLHLPFALLSDSALALSTALHLPTFEVSGMTLIRRLTVVADAGCIVKVFYPVFPPDRNADEVSTWLAAAKQR